MARRYAISSLQEARAYLEEPQLQTRLEDVISTIAEQLQGSGQSLTNLMGGELDAAKTISCLTLFEAAGLESAGALLDRLGKHCPLTLRALHTSKSVGLLESNQCWPRPGTDVGIGLVQAENSTGTTHSSGAASGSPSGESSRQ